MRIRSMAITVALLVLAATAGAQTVTYDMDKTANFAKFRTYAWVRGTEIPDEWNHQRVVTAVDAQLALRGMTPVGAGQNPDVYVAYHAAFDRTVQISGSGWGGPAISRSGTARAEEVLVGTIVVDVIDASSRTIVWRGIATKEIDTRADPEKREKNINRAAEKLFKKYPAGKQARKS